MSAFHSSKAGLFTGPVIKPVFMIKRRLKRSGISIGRVNPSTPPQSWQTSVMFRRSICRRKASMYSRWKSKE